MIPRLLNRLWARALGCFWLPCPVCGNMFGGHESGSVMWVSPGSGTLVCRRPQCNYEAGAMSNAEVFEAPASNATASEDDGSLPMPAVVLHKNGMFLEFSCHVPDDNLVIEASGSLFLILRKVESIFHETAVFEVVDAVGPDDHRRYRYQSVRGVALPTGMVREGDGGSAKCTDRSI